MPIARLLPPRTTRWWLAGSGLAAILIGGLLWSFHRADRLASANPSEGTPVAATAGVAAAPPVTAADVLFYWQKASAFLAAPFNSLPLVAAPLESVFGDGFRELIKPPPGSRQDAPPLDPRKMRALMDRGVVIYAKATDDKTRQKGAELIETAALLGFSPARRLITRNYPISEPVRRAVPARDVINYAIDFFAGPEIDSEDTKGIFVALAQRFAQDGQIEFFATHLLEGLRGDSRPQLSHRIDIMMDLFVRVRGACVAVARIVSQPSQSAADACSVNLAEDLRRFVGSGHPIDREADLRRRGLVMLDQTELH
jgi:hypothetical protein